MVLELRGIERMLRAAELAKVASLTLRLGWPANLTAGHH